MINLQKVKRSAFHSQIVILDKTLMMFTEDGLVYTIKTWKLKKAIVLLMSLEQLMLALVQEQECTHQVEFTFVGLKQQVTLIAH